MIKSHYDMIHPFYFSKSVLDVACGDGTNQYKSTNWKIIDKAIHEDRYTGIDIMHPPSPDGITYINIDLFDYEPEHQFDTVLAIHIIEHIELDRWPELFDKLKSWVKPNGYLIVGAPYGGSHLKYENFKGPEPMRHVVFGIYEGLLLPYYPGRVKFERYRGPFGESFICYWRKPE